MSDSVEGDVPRPGAAKASAERPDGKAEGGLKAEDAERFAAAFVPVWQFDEAPFSAGARFSAGELEELGASRGVRSPDEAALATPLQWMQQLHRGGIGDSAAWLTFGTATIGAVLALGIR